MKYNLITYGCTANQADSELMQTFLEKEGHKKTSLKDSEYIIVNTCGVKKSTEEKIINRLKKLSQTDKKIIVGGCLPKANLERIKKETPTYSAILDTRSINKLPELIQKIENGKKPIEFSEEVFSKPSFAKSYGLTGTIQISEGCDLSCTYCSTTISRGDLSCFSVEDIVRGVSTLVKTGSKEILLTSQDNGAYVNGNKCLPDLLDEICKIDADFYLRNGMSNPVYLHKFLDKLISSYKNPKIYKFLHIPVQSGSDTVLKEMKRGYKTERFLEIVSRFGKTIPDLTLSTDIIVGFPNETEDDFKQTLNLLKQTKPDAVNISKFGKRPGTKAAEIEGVADKIVKRRSAECSKIAAKISLENNKKWIGWNGRIFVNEASLLPLSLEKKGVSYPKETTIEKQLTKSESLQHPKENEIENKNEITNSIKETIIQIGGEKMFIGRNFAYKTVLIKTKKNIFGLEVDVQIINAKQTHLIGEII